MIQHFLNEIFAHFRFDTQRLIATLFQFAQRFRLTHTPFPLMAVNMPGLPRSHYGTHVKLNTTVTAAHQCFSVCACGVASGRHTTTSASWYSMRSLAVKIGVAAATMREFAALSRSRRLKYAIVGVRGNLPMAWACAAGRGQRSVCPLVCGTTDQDSAAIVTSTSVAPVTRMRSVTLRRKSTPR